MKSSFGVAAIAGLGISLALTSVPAASHASQAPAPIIGTASTTDPAWPIDRRGDGCTTPIWPSAPASARNQRLLVIGDSLIRNSRTILESRARTAGWIPTVRCWGAKGTDWGLQQVLRARQLKQLPKTVVISLGTNDIWWLGLDLGRGVDAIMAELGPNRQVYWVNLWFGPHGYDRLPPPTAANRLLRQKAKEYPNLKIVNFAKAFRTAQKAGLPVGWQDGVHLNSAGNEVRVRAIVDAIGSPKAKAPKRPSAH